MKHLLKILKIALLLLKFSHTAYQASVAVNPSAVLVEAPAVDPVFPFNSTKLPYFDPLVTSWMVPTGMSEYFAPTNINRVQYTLKYVFVSSSGIPSYSMGPWSGESNKPNLFNSLNHVYLRLPVEKKDGKISASGLIGQWINGVAMMSANDGGNEVWKRNEYFFEKDNLDACLGRVNEHGEYYHRVMSSCLNALCRNDTGHSPIVGFAFDGFPVYGPFGFSDAKKPSATVKRMTSGYKLRNIVERTTLADGTLTERGPSIDSVNPLGAYIDDYEYDPLHGDLDEFNARFCVTPEYPEGTYAYFLTTDSENHPVYPYTIGPHYFGNIMSTDTDSSNTYPVDYYLYGCYETYQYTWVEGGDSEKKDSMEMAQSAEYKYSGYYGGSNGEYERPYYGDSNGEYERPYYGDSNGEYERPYYGDSNEAYGCTYLDGWTNCDYYYGWYTITTVHQCGNLANWNMYYYVPTYPTDYDYYAYYKNYVDPAIVPEDYGNTYGQGASNVFFRDENGNGVLSSSHQSSFILCIFALLFSFFML